MRLLVLALVLVACQQPLLPPCECECECVSSFKATAPQVGKGCWVSGDLLTCPLVRRELEIQPAFPSEDPRCEKLEDGTLECRVFPVE
jgi:hypothetical protein